MTHKRRVSPMALLIAVLTAFVVGLLGSLAVRDGESVPAAQSAHRLSQSGIESVRWRATSSYTNSMPVIGGVPQKLASLLAEVSSGAIELQTFEPGEVVPALEVTESVKEGKVAAGFQWIGYDQGRIPASTLIAAVPFGMEPSEFIAWWYYGDGQQLGEALYAEHNIMPLLCTIVGPETGGWFIAPLNSLDDLAGLKIRFAGIGGKVLQRLGASVTMIPGGEIFQALEKGAIDASEFSLPAVDELLGFGRVAKYNYFPGWHQPFSTGHLQVNLDTWNALRPETQALFRLGCKAMVADTLAESEAMQGPIIRDFAAQGVTAAQLPDDILRELHRVSNEVLDEEAAADDQFAEMLESQREFSAAYDFWQKNAYLPRDF